MSTIVRDFNVPNGATIGTSNANRIRLLGSSSGNAVSISAEGSDANISISLIPKGTGIINIPATTGLTFAGNDPNTVLYLDSTNSVTSTPLFRFDGLNLTVTGNVTGKSFIPTGTIVPTQGIYKYASNSVGIATNSTGVVFISNTGKVGIGRIPTAYILETANDISVNGVTFGLGNSHISSNIAIGSYSLYNNTTGNNNLSIGNNSLQQNLGGTNNTSIGNNALTTNLLGANNIAIGNNSLYNNTTGVGIIHIIDGGTNYINGTYDNVQLTKESGSSANTYPTATITVEYGVVVNVILVTSGSGFIDNSTILTAPSSILGISGSGFKIGINSLISGSDNISIGYTSLYNNTIGTHNIAIGSSTLSLNTTGNNNIGNGFNSLYSNTSGSNNISFGNSSLYKNTTGNSNYASGSNSLYNNINGSDNISFGNSSLYNNVSGSKNISIGTLSLSSNVGGVNNVALGYQAGYNSSTGITSGNCNTYIGYNSTSSVNNITNSTALGNGATITASNQMVFGNSSITVNLMNGSLLVGTSTNINNSGLVVNGVIETTQGGIRFPDGTLLSSATAGTLTTITTTALGQVQVDSFPATSYRTAKYLIQITSTVSHHVIELLLIHNGSVVYLVQYGEIFTNLSLGSFDATITAGNIVLLFTPANAASTLRILRQTLNV